MKFLYSIHAAVKKALNEFNREISFNSKKTCSHSHSQWSEIRQLKCIFVLSTGRAGTKLLSEVLKKSSNLWVEHSPHPELAHQSSLVYRAKLSGESLEWAFLHARLDLLSTIYKSGHLYVETNNRISLYAPGIAKLLPNAKFIHLVRHPAEFVRSGMRRGYYEHMEPEQSGHLVPREGDPVFDSWDRMHRIEKIAWQWNEINAHIESFKRNFSSERVFFLKSDELFSQVDAISKIERFIEIDAINPRTVQRVLSRKVNSQEKGQFPSYQEWSVEQKNMLKKWAPLAEAYGFDIQ